MMHAAAATIICAAILSAAISIPVQIAAWFADRSGGGGNGRTWLAGAAQGAGLLVLIVGAVRGDLATTAVAAPVMALCLLLGSHPAATAERLEVPTLATGLSGVVVLLAYRIAGLL